VDEELIAELKRRPMGRLFSLLPMLIDSRLELLSFAH
jgi:hypothetical protein